MGQKKEESSRQFWEEPSRASGSSFPWPFEPRGRGLHADRLDDDVCTVVSSPAGSTAAVRNNGVPYVPTFAAILPSRAIRGGQPYLQGVRHVRRDGEIHQQQQPRGSRVHAVARGCQPAHSACRSQLTAVVECE